MIGAQREAVPMLSNCRNVEGKTSWHDGRFYSAVYNLLGGGEVSRIVTDFVEPNSSVIDIGCGPGIFILDLVETRQPVRAVGIDLSSKMIAHAEKVAKQKQLQNIDFYHLNALELTNRIQ